MLIYGIFDWRVNFGNHRRRGAPGRCVDINGIACSEQDSDGRARDRSGVKEAIKELGFTPNILAPALVRASTQEHRRCAVSYY
jgi:hypothetical protein